LRRGERPRAPIVDVMRVESVDYLLERFGLALDREAAFKAKSLVTAKVMARLEKVAVKEPEFAHILAEVAERVLGSFGQLMASPDAARHVYNALFYFFEGYQTRDGEVLFARIERTVREAVRKAEEAGVSDAEYRIKQFILWLIKRLEEASERYRRDALKGIYTVEKALRATALAGFSAALYSVYHGLYSEAVVSSVASAVALAEVGQFREAVEYVQKAAKTLYEAAKEMFEQVKVTVQRLVELFVEAVTRVLAWIDEHRAYLFLMTAVAAGVIALSVALNLWGLIELEKLAYAASAAPFVAAGVEADERRVAEVVRLAEGALGKLPALVPGGGVVSAEVERWLAGLRSGEVKTAVARLAEELEKWLKAVKSGRYVYHSSGRAARIWAAYVAPALFFTGGGVELRVVVVSEAVVAEVGRRLEAVRGASGVQYDALAASARRGVLTAAKAGDVTRLWKAYIDGGGVLLDRPCQAGGA
jgi:tetratricopeptide (TPR) repeat protein